MTLRSIAIKKSFCHYVKMIFHLPLVIRTITAGTPGLLPEETARDVRAANSKALPNLEPRPWYGTFMIARRK